MEAAAEQPILNVVGEKVALGPLRRDLLPVYLRWMNDFVVTRTLGVALRPFTSEAEEAWFAAVSTASNEANFTIYERATLRPIGNTGLRQVDHRERTADFGILIGERDCWGRGYGTEATRLVLDFGFHALGLHNVWLSVFSQNERAIRAYARAGFRVVGRRREAHRIGGRAYDIVYMDCLVSEFESPRLQRLVHEGED
jgi:RimJ/RimL family protein N-acetyltransferase